MAEKEKFFNKKLKVINIGIEMFADDLKRQNVDVIHVDWQPPAGGDLDILKLLEKLESSWLNSWNNKYLRIAKNENNSILVKPSLT